MNNETAVEKQRIVEEAMNNPDVQRQLEEMQASLRQVSERMPRDPTWYETVWSYIKWPLLIGGLGAGLYFGWPYLRDWIHGLIDAAKKQFEDYHRKLLEQHGKAITQTDAPVEALGGGQVVSKYTADTNRTGVGGSSGSGGSDSIFATGAAGAKAAAELQQKLEGPNQGFGINRPRP